MPSPVSVRSISIIILSILLSLPAVAQKHKKVNPEDRQVDMDSPTFVPMVRVGKVLDPAPAEEKTVGGIIIPDTAKEKPLQGTVVAVGRGTKDEEMVLKAGDQVLYGKYAGTELEHEGKKYLVMRQSDVVAVLA